MLSNKKISKYYFLFILTHLTLWTLIPSFTNLNLPLDTIEAIAWGSNLDWGFNKHPPLSALAVEIFYMLFGNQDFFYYLLSQIFVITAFLIVFKFSNEFFKNNNLAFFSLILLEGIFFYKYTTPEFNVNIAQLPFWSLAVYFTWRCTKNDNYQDYIFLGIFFGLGILSKYLFFYLIAGINLLFFYHILKKKIKIFHAFLSNLTCLLIIVPHLVWLFDNNFVTLTYGLQRTTYDSNLIDHIIYPVSFIFKQIGLLSPFFLMTFLLVKKFNKIKIIYNERIVFLCLTCLAPILLIVLTSFVMGTKIRTMWMTPFYLFFGVLFIEVIKKQINFKNLKKFYLSFLFFFLISPSIYLTDSLSNDDKRTDFPGKEIARLVQNKWNDNFTNEIKIVVGDEWYAGNLSYHLSSRPKWIIEMKEENLKLNEEEGVIYTGNPNILKKICPGVYGTIRPVGYCMIGRK